MFLGSSCQRYTVVPEVWWSLHSLESCMLHDRVLQRCSTFGDSSNEVWVGTTFEDIQSGAIGLAQARLTLSNVLLQSAPLAWSCLSRLPTMHLYSKPWFGSRACTAEDAAGKISRFCSAKTLLTPSLAGPGQTETPFSDVFCTFNSASGSFLPPSRVKIKSTANESSYHAWKHNLLNATQLEYENQKHKWPSALRKGRRKARFTLEWSAAWNSSANCLSNWPPAKRECQANLFHWFHHHVIQKTKKQKCNYTVTVCFTSWQVTGGMWRNYVLFIWLMNI